MNDRQTARVLRGFVMFKGMTYSCRAGADENPNDPLISLYPLFMGVNRERIRTGLELGGSLESPSLKRPIGHSRLAIEGNTIDCHSYIHLVVQHHNNGAIGTTRCMSVITRRITLHETNTNTSYHALFAGLFRGGKRRYKGKQQISDFIKPERIWYV